MIQSAKVGRTKVGWQKAGKGEVIKGRYPNAGTMLLVDSDDEGLSFIDSEVRKWKYRW